MEASKAQRKRAEEAPPPSEWKKEFGDKCKVSEDGQSFDLTVHEPHEIRKAYEMQSGSRKIDVEQGAKEQAKLSREWVTRRDGTTTDIAEEVVDRVKHRFKGSAGRYGKAPTQYYAMAKNSIPKWSRVCSVCGEPQGLWRQWTKPECDDSFECDKCESKDDWFWDRDVEE